MRSAAGTPLRRLAIVLGAVAVALAVTVPIALSSGSASGPGHELQRLCRRQAARPTRGSRRSSSARSTRREARSSSDPAGRTGSGPPSSTSTATWAASRATRSSSATASPPPRRRRARSAARSSPTTSGSRSSSSVRSPSATSRSTPRSATAKPTVGGVELLPVDAAAEERLRALRDERLGARAVGHVRQERPEGEDRCGRLHAGPGNRLRGAGREGQPRVGGDQDDDGRLRCERDRPDRAADRRGRAERGHDRPADACKRLCRRRQGACAAREEQHAGRLEPALPRPRCRGGARRRPGEVGLRHRLVARVRRLRPGSAAVPQGPEGRRPAEAGGRRMGDRRLGPDPDDREADEPDRRQEGDLRELHQGDPGVQGPAGPRRSEPQLREVPGRAGRLQRPGPVLPVPWEPASSSGSPASSGLLRRSSSGASSTSSLLEGGAASAAPPFGPTR